MGGCRGWVVAFLTAGLLLGLAAGGWLWWRGRPEPKPDIAVVGGTVLTFEVDGSAPDAATERLLVERLQGRMGKRLRHVTVEPAGQPGRVRVLVPRAGDNDADVAEVLAR